MKEEMLAFISERVRWHQQEHARLRKEERGDEAAHLQIAINVYNIFLSTYQAMQYDLAETLRRFSAIVDTWDQNHRRACEHDDPAKKFIEEIKINRALEIIRRAKELELTHHD